MASDAELNHLASEEWSYCPLEADGIAVAQTLDAIARGDHVPTVHENGRSRSFEVKSHTTSVREASKKVWPRVLAVGVIGVLLYTHERLNNIYYGDQVS